MYVPDVQLHESATLEEATKLMSRYEPNARFMAGGTDVLVDLKSRRYGIDHLISISRIDDLCGVPNSADGLRIGALTTITELIRSPLVREACPAILDAATQMAAPQIRNVATVGGNIACAAPCADLPPILMALDASLFLVSPTGQRSLALESFFRGPRETAIGRNELLTAVHVPLSPAWIITAVGLRRRGFSIRLRLTMAVPTAMFPDSRVGTPVERGRQVAYWRRWLVSQRGYYLRSLCRTERFMKGSAPIRRGAAQRQAQP